MIQEFVVAVVDILVGPHILYNSRSRSRAGLYRLSEGLGKPKGRSEYSARQTPSIPRGINAPRSLRMCCINRRIIYHGVNHVNISPLSPGGTALNLY